MLDLISPGIEFRILCLEDSVISFISPSLGGSPGPVQPICAQRWPKARFISFHFISFDTVISPHFYSPGDMIHCSNKETLRPSANQLCYLVTAGECEDGWIYSSTYDLCHYVSTSALDKSSAISQCVSLGGVLVSTPDSSKNNYITSIS